MASSSGMSSGSGLSALQNVQNSRSEDLQQIMDQRKRKRMISNRESARRSRMRKQKHLDELICQVTQLRQDNNQIITNLSFTTQQFVNIEAENSILRAQVVELSQRLQSLNEINSFLKANNGGFGIDQEFFNVSETEFGLMNNSWSYIHMNQQSVMASADMLQY